MIFSVIAVMMSALSIDFSFSISAVLARRSALSFPLTPACPGVKIHVTFRNDDSLIALTHFFRMLTASIFLSIFMESVTMQICFTFTFNSFTHSSALDAAITSIFMLDVIVWKAFESSHSVIPFLCAVNAQALLSHLTTDPSL